MTDIEWYIILIYALKADIYIVFKTDIYIALKTAPIPISGSGIPIFYAEDCMHAALEKAAWRVTDIYFLYAVYQTD